MSMFLGIVVYMYSSSQQNKLTVKCFPSDEVTGVVEHIKAQSLLPAAAGEKSADVYVANSVAKELRRQLEGQFNVR